ncbi:MAG: deoxyribose-phosphate aldolase [Kiritimatiellae bacterium]|nr:deoxyribose-phosphate aldolase [Kiritimatiellia bacterium]
MKHPLRIALGSDHGGLELKQGLLPFLQSLGHHVQDCGTHDKNPVDYPLIARDVAERVADRRADFGIVVDGAGIGSAMAANKVRGVRAAACYNEALALNSREHNDANLLTLGAGQTTLETAKAIVSVFLDKECTAERHQRRVQLIGEIEQGRRGGPALPAPVAALRKEMDVDLSPDDIEKITARVREILAGGSAVAAPPPVDAATLAGMIDHTLLKPEASAADVEKLCREAIDNGFYSVCVNSGYVAQAAKHVKGTPVKVCSVVGFPLGAMAPEIKALEARKAIREGAREIDMVINVGALKGGDDALVLKDIRGVVEVCQDGRSRCKVILETALLNEAEKVRACELSMKARADFVKTSTGFGPGGATVEDIRLMARTVAPKKLGVKASGGVRTYQDALNMIAAGATRIGASSSVKILEEARGGKPVTEAKGSY